MVFIFYPLHLKPIWEIINDTLRITDFFMANLHAHYCIHSGFAIHYTEKTNIRGFSKFRWWYQPIQVFTLYFKYFNLHDVWDWLHLLLTVPLPDRNKIEIEFDRSGLQHFNTLLIAVIIKQTLFRCTCSQQNANIQKICD